VKDCVKGNPEARKVLYDMHAPQMLSLCYRYARSKDDAEDIFQKGFYLVYKNIGQLKDPLALRGWVKRIFVNAALQHNQQKQTLYPLNDCEGEEMAGVNDALSNLETAELTKLIQALPRRCREVFNMYVVEGYSHKEIAEAMNISVGTSKSQLHDARKTLQEAVIKNSNRASRKIKMIT